MVERKVNITEKDHQPFYRYLTDKLFDEYNIEDLFIATALGVGVGCLYLKMCKKRTK